MTINNSKFFGNIAYSGGAAYFINCEFSNIFYTAVIDNIAISSGGGIVLQNSLIFLKDSLIANNKATVGGGIRFID